VKRIFLYIALLISTAFLVGCSAVPSSHFPAPDSKAAEKMTVVETAIVSADVDTPNHLEFLNRFSPEVRDRYLAWMHYSPDAMVETPNELLAPFGYRLEQNPIMSSYSFRLFRDGDMLLDGITYFWSATVKSDGRDFVLQVEMNNGTIFLVRSGQMHEWRADRHFYISPIFAGDHLVTLEDSNGHVVVMEDEMQVFSMPAAMGVANPVKGLTAWEGHWVLEVDGRVIIDGIDLDTELGYDQIFNWSLIGGQPFYFFVDAPNSGVHVSYAGIDQAQSYQEIIHDACCEPAAFNPQFNEHIITFYGRRNGMWYYVQMGVFDE
jgi:hypothetical protein